MTDTLKARQDAGANVEKRMIAFLISFLTAGRMTLNDAKEIADVARAVSFDEFSIAAKDN